MIAPALSTTATTATLEAVRVMVATGCLGPDAAFQGSASRRSELTPEQAFLLRKFLHRHAALVPDVLLAAALSDEADPPAILVARARGRARVGAEPLSAAERSRRRRAAVAVTTVELPVALVDRLRTMRDVRGISMAELIGAAVDALTTEPK